jgi:hypothetical protein
MKWYQFHLSTMIAVMLAASVLLGLNFTPQPPPKVDREGFDVIGHSYGWPSVYHDAKVVRTPQPLNSNALWLG